MTRRITYASLTCAIFAISVNGYYALSLPGIKYLALTAALVSFLALLAQVSRS